MFRFSSSNSVFKSLISESLRSEPKTRKENVPILSHVSLWWCECQNLSISMSFLCSSLLTVVLSSSQLSTCSATCPVSLFLRSPCLIFFTKLKNYEFTCRNICKDRCIISKDLHCFSRKDNKYSHFYFGKLSSCGIFIIG